MIGQGRSSQRYRQSKCDFSARLTKRLRELAAKHPRYGYRRMTALLRGEGWRVNRKRIQRLWRVEGLRVPIKQRKRRRLGNIDGSISRRRAEHRQDVWSYDFVMDQTEDGRRLKMLPIVDEFSRECLTVEVARHLTGQDVINTLDKLFKERGAPRHLRSDNGPEFVACAIKEWLASAAGDKTFAPSETSDDTVEVIDGASALSRFCPCCATAVIVKGVSDSANAKIVAARRCG